MGLLGLRRIGKGILHAGGIPFAKSMAIQNQGNYARNEVNKKKCYRNNVMLVKKHP